MTQTAQPETRNFADFYFDDDVCRLADGLIPELSHRAGLTAEGETPDLEKIGRLVGILGKNEVLRDNVEVEFLSLAEMAGYAERSGVQTRLDRSLMRPDRSTPGDIPRLVTGAVANWQDRARNLLVQEAPLLDDYATIHLAVGNRLMDTKTEVPNPNVADFRDRYGEFPTEGMYAARYVVPHLIKAGYGVHLNTYDSGDGARIAANFVSDNKELFVPGNPMAYVRVANAGLHLALQFRAAARRIRPDYDGRVFGPDVYIKTDSLPLAWTSDHAAQPTSYQAPQPALRQAVLTAKLLKEAQIADQEL